MRPARVIQEGDLVKLDLALGKDRYFADAAVTVIAGDANPTAHALARCAQSAFRHGARAARAGNTAYEVSRAMERETRSSGFEPVRGLCGQGVGRTIHEDPCVRIVATRDDGSDSFVPAMAARVLRRTADDLHGKFFSCGSLRAHDCDYEDGAGPADRRGMTTVFTWRSPGSATARSSSCCPAAKR